MYVLSGRGQFGPAGSSAVHEAHHTLVTSKEANETCLEVTATEDLHFVLIAGKPLNVWLL